MIVVIRTVSKVCPQITHSNSTAERVTFYIFLSSNNHESCLTWTTDTPRYEMSLIQQSREGHIRGNTTVREVENVLEHRGEREGHAGRDRGERRGNVEGLSIEGDRGGKGWARIKEGRGETPTDMISRIGSGDLRIKRREERRWRRLKSRERGSQAKARGGWRDRVMGETEQRVQGKGRGGGQHCASQWGLCAVWRGLGPGCCVCVQTGRTEARELFPGKWGLLLGQWGLERKAGGGHTQGLSDKTGVEGQWE